jgi:hypothetical protein
VKTSASGALAGIVAAIALAPPALGAPANVTVRVEGTGATLVPETALATTTAPVVRDGHSCSGTSALGALDAATAGNWSGTYYDAFSDWSVETIAGERHAYPDSGSWGLWRNATYSETGLCSTELQAGDEVLLAPADDGPILELGAVPATVAPGQPVTVTVLEHGVSYRSKPPYDLIRADGPAADATVTYGGATATVGADGRAQLVFARSGPATVQATEAGHVRSAVRRTCATTGSDGACGTSAAGSSPPPPPPPPPAPDTTAPVAAFSPGLVDGKVFSRRRAPRELSGTVSADPSGLRSVRLSILRRRGDSCWTFRDTTERFKRHRCGGKWYFRIGDREEWSYLLPRKLPRGRYTIGVMAVDKAFNESRTELEIRVR